MTDPAASNERDRDLFERHLRSFVPPTVFDAHAHLWPAGATGLANEAELLPAVSGDVNLAVYRQSMASWMGDRAPRDGVFFALPSSPRVDIARSNQHIAIETLTSNTSRGLMLIRPGDGPAEIEQQLNAHRWAGFKVYHTFASRHDTMHAEIDEYLPRWAWELADKYALVIMLHLVKARALADAENQRQLRESLSRWKNAKLVLAHAARGFCAQHTVEGIASLAGFENVYFDTSVVCESPAIIAILKTFGAGRLLYGSDFPICCKRGKCISVGDKFEWLFADSHPARSSQWTLVGIESLLAIQQSAMLCTLSDGDVERIFSMNAQGLLATRL